MPADSVRGDLFSRIPLQAKYVLLACALAAILFAGCIDFLRLRADELTEHRDIHALWEEGAHIRRFENPYARTLGADPNVNQKYATYFPLYYLLSAASQTFCPTYPRFIAFWRAIFFLFYAAVAVLIAWPFYRRGQYVLAFFAMMFWLFNRWTLKSVELMHIDFMAIFAMLLSLLIWDRSRRTSLLMLGISLAIKQVAIFLLPLYLVWEWNTAAAPQRLRRTALALMWIIIIPLVVSLPFIVAGPKAFVRSINFSTVRTDEFFASPAPSIDHILGAHGIAAKMPMLCLMGLIYFAAYRRGAPRYFAALLVMAIFVEFNTTWFRQYALWPVALLPWVALDLPSHTLPKLESPESPHLA